MVWRDPTTVSPLRLAVSAGFWGLMVGTLAGCSNEGNPFAETDGDDASSLASLSVSGPFQCDVPQFDVGLTNRLSHQHTFHVRNGSPQPMSVERIVKDCSCTDASAETAVVQPGESLAVTVATRANPGDADVHGIVPFRTTAVVYLAAGTEPPVPFPLVLEGRYIPPVVVDNPNRRIEIDIGERTVQTHLRVRLDRGAGVRLVAVEFPEWMTVNLKRDSEAWRPTANDRFERKRIDVSGKVPDHVKLPTLVYGHVRSNAPDMPEVHVPLVLALRDARRSSVAPQHLALGVQQSGGVAVKTLVVSWPESALDFDLQRDVVASCERVKTTLNRIVERDGKRFAMLNCEVDTTGVDGKFEEHITVSLRQPGSVQVAEEHQVRISAFAKAGTGHEEGRDESDR